jgi:hypothetical protein
MADINFIKSVRILDHKFKENLFSIRQLDSELSEQKKISIRKGDYQPLTPFLRRNLFTPICIITFGNAVGKYMERILNILQILNNEITSPNIIVTIFSADPDYANPEIWSNFVSAMREQFQQKNYTVTETDIPKVFSFSDCTRSDKCIYGHVAYIGEAMPSLYAVNDLAFTEQIIRDRSFAFSDACIPGKNYPFMEAVPFLKNILNLNGYIIVDNDAWHELTAPDLGAQYLQGRYMETMCEVPYIIRTFLNSPKTKFVYGNRRSTTEFQLINFEDTFNPNLHITRIPRITGGRKHKTRRTRSKRKGLNTRKYSKKR